MHAFTALGTHRPERLGEVTQTPAGERTLNERLRGVRGSILLYSVKIDFSAAQ